MVNHSITAVGGVRVGQAVDARNLTGTTVVLFDRPAQTVVDVRCGWPGTFDTDSLGSGRTYQAKHAVFLTGGDVFGLKCAFGIQRFLLERSKASVPDPQNLPAVVGANIFDLEFGKQTERVDYEELGYKACRDASARPVQQGNTGAGLGATVGKLAGIGHAMKGGVGSSVKAVGDSFAVGALVVVNAVGNVFDREGMTIAGTRNGKGAFLEMEDIADQLVYAPKDEKSRRATTIGVVATDLNLSHEELLRVVEMAHDGIARCVRPAHGATDGDTLFCVSTARTQPKRQGRDLITLVGHLAATQVQSAVLNAVAAAKPVAGIPASA